MFLDDMFRSMAKLRGAIEAEELARNAPRARQNRLAKAVREAQDENAAIERRTEVIFNAYVKRVLARSDETE